MEKTGVEKPHVKKRKDNADNDDTLRRQLSDDGCQSEEKITSMEETGVEKLQVKMRKDNADNDNTLRIQLSHQKEKK